MILVVVTGGISGGYDSGGKIYGDLMHGSW